MSYESPPPGYPPPPGPWPQQPWPPDVVRQEGTARRGGFLGFMTSLPGVLTALAALVTAVTGGIGLYLSQGDEPPPGGDIYVFEAAPVPEGSGAVDAGDLGDGLPETSGDDDVTVLVDGCLNGDPDACDTLLYVLAEACYQGDLLSCDDLYQISAVGSDFEDYGATCGGRVDDWTYAGVCSEP
jgi:hypothetical protein